MKRAGQRIIPVCISACVLTGGRSGRTEPAAAVRESAAVSVQNSGSSSQDEASAEAAYRRGRAAYAAGDVGGALEGMRESYRLSGRSELLFNIARLERELGHCDAARDDYRGYLMRVPNGKYRGDAERAASELDNQCGAAHSIAPSLGVVPRPASREFAAPQPRRAVAQPYWTNERLLGWSFISAGVLAAGGAIYFNFAALSARRQAASSIVAEERGGPDWNESFQDRQHRDSTVAQVLGVASGVFVLGGTIALLMSPRGSEHSARATVSFQPGLVKASCGVSF